MNSDPGSCWSVVLTFGLIWLKTGFDITCLAVMLRMHAKHTSLLEKAENVLGSHNVYDPFDFFPSETGFLSLSDVE